MSCAGLVCFACCRVQVTCELLKQDPEGVSIADDENHLPVELAAVKAYTAGPALPVMELVMDMLTKPAEAEVVLNMYGRPSYAGRPAFSIAQTAASKFIC